MGVWVCGDTMSPTIFSFFDFLILSSFFFILFFNVFYLSFFIYLFFLTFCSALNLKNNKIIK